VALGIVLILVGVAMFVAFILWGVNDPATIDIAGLRADTNSLVVFVIGAVAAALIFLGMRSLLNGIRRDVRRMRKTRELKQKAETATRAAEVATREAEKAKESAQDQAQDKPVTTSEPKDQPAKADGPEKPAQP